MKVLAGLAAAAPLMGSIAAAEDAPLRDRHGLRLYAATRLTIEIADANQFEFEKGLGGVAAAGIEIGERWRFEFAFSRRSTNITGIPPLPADGSFSTWTHMANAFWHPLGLDARVSPYVGAGVGYNLAKLSAISTDPAPQYAGLGFPAQRHVSVAAQGQIGVAIRATERFTVDVAGAYYTSGDNAYVSTFTNNPTVEAAYRTYSAQIGVRFRF
jgi:opacity protein-like surface antigen